MFMINSILTNKIYAINNVMHDPNSFLFFHLFILIDYLDIEAHELQKVIFSSITIYSNYTS